MDLRNYSALGKKKDAKVNNNLVMFPYLVMIHNNESLQNDIKLF